jgi:hypothetical protein
MSHPQLKKAILAYLPIFCFIYSCQAQDSRERVLYDIAVGVKCYEPGISIKVNSKEGYVLEFQAFYSAKGVKLGTMYEFQTKLNDRLGWYAGGGGFLSVWNHTWKTKKCMCGGDGSLGAEGVVGLDYKPEGMPFDISFDWQPLVTFMGPANGNSKINPLFGGIGLRFAF